jgi:hypothetical protein
VPIEPPTPARDDGEGGDLERMLAAAQCSNCGVYSTALLRCSRCKRAHFCDRKCQAAAWPKHKLECKPAAVRTDAAAESGDGDDGAAGLAMGPDWGTLCVGATLLSASVGTALLRWGRR